ncbi:MAG: cytochrome c5 family protein [Rhodocyclales bacterium]|nr:cytochrome c5 family protein [Rhodocyclales bacterium]
MTQRLLPAIIACVAASSALADPFNGNVSVGRRVYVEVCAACHANGVAGAPRFGNRAEWEMRVLLGRKELVRSVLKGKGAMPPKGGNASVSDLQAEAAMDYMLAGVR